MRTSLIAGAVAVVAVFAGVLYFARDRSPPVPSAAQNGKSAVAAPEPAKPAPLPQSVSRASSEAARPVTSDPRLAKLMVSPNDDLIEFFAVDGRVIKEVDNDPSSAGFRMPLREYTYAGDKVIRLVTYKYLGGQTQIITVDITYRPDGSVDQYQESTRYDPAE